MSGGHFSYWQSHIGYIAEDIEDIIRKNGKIIPFDELDRWDKENYDPKDPPKYSDFRKETIREFRKAVKCLRRAYVYAQRIDYLLSGDDGETTFHERLKEDLGK